jgi:hypothetical protein
MAVIEGQIEPLKKLKEILHQNGISRFGSIGDINDFIKNYETEKNEIPKLIENKLDAEINQLQANLAEYQQNYDILKADVSNEIDVQVKALEEKLELAKGKSNKRFIHKIFCYPKIKVLMNKKANLEKNFESIVRKKTRLAEQEVSRTKGKLNDYTTNREALISGRSCNHHKS